MSPTADIKEQDGTQGNQEQHREQQQGMLLPKSMLKVQLKPKQGWKSTQSSRTAEVREPGGSYHENYVLSFTGTPSYWVPLKVLNKDLCFFTESPSHHVQIHKYTHPHSAFMNKLCGYFGNPTPCIPYAVVPSAGISYVPLDEVLDSQTRQIKVYRATQQFLMEQKQCWKHHLLLGGVLWQKHIIWFSLIFEQRHSWLHLLGQHTAVCVFERDYIHTMKPWK